MGTRNLTCVVLDGEYKVAQYAQWDGYPDGQGLAALKFLSQDAGIKNLKRALAKVRFLDVEKEGDKKFLDDYNKNAPTWSSDPDNRTEDQKRWNVLYVSRNIGADILANIANATDKEIILLNELAFAGESLFCEWAYVIDFDKGTFEVYEGYNKEPLADDERFKDMKKDDEYAPVRLVAKFDLDSLPSNEEFLSKFKTDGDEEE